MQELIGPEPAQGVPPSLTKRIINKRKEESFLAHWTNTPNCRQAKNCIRIDKKSSKFLINISRTRLKTYTGVTTGHFGFNKHLTTLGKRTDSSCELCGDQQDTAEHFLCYCPAFIINRRKHLGEYIIGYNLIKTLKPINILNYIVSTGRFNETVGV